MLSTPGKARTAAAILLYLIAGLGAVVWKVLRSGMTDSTHIPPWIAGVMPNLIPAAFMPLLVFATNKVVRFRDYLAMVATMLAVLCAYEFAQTRMPTRTFDWADVAASAVGSCFGCLIGWLVFFRCLASKASPSEFNTEQNDETVA